MNTFCCFLVFALALGAKAFPADDMDQTVANAVEKCTKEHQVDMSKFEDFEKDMTKELDGDTECFIECMAIGMDIVQDGKVNSQMTFVKGELSDCLKGITSEGCKYSVDVMVCLKQESDRVAEEH